MSKQRSRRRLRNCSVAALSSLSNGYEVRESDATASPLSPWYGANQFAVYHASKRVQTR